VTAGWTGTAHSHRPRAVLPSAPRSRAGEPPFGLIGDGAGDELTDFFGRIADRIAAAVDDLRDRIANLLDEIL